MGFSISFTQFCVLCLFLYLLFGNPLSSLKLFKEIRNKQLKKDKIIQSTKKLPLISKKYSLLISKLLLLKSYFYVNNSIIKNKKDLNNFIKHIETFDLIFIKDFNLIRLNSDSVFHFNLNLDFDLDSFYNSYYIYWSKRFMLVPIMYYEHLTLHNFIIILSSKFHLKLPIVIDFNENIYYDNIFNFFKQFSFVLDNLFNNHFSYILRKTKIKKDKNFKIILGIFYEEHISSFDKLKYYICFNELY